MVTLSPNNQRQTFSYDAVGLKRSINATGAGRSTFVFDAASQLSSLRNGNNERTTFSYDDAGRRTVQRNANGTRVSTVYDAASQTTQVIQRSSAGATLQQLDYRYDNAGNRNVMIEGAGSARMTWSYDKQNQLTGKNRTGTNAYRQTFTYDPAGNRTLTARANWHSFTFDSIRLELKPNSSDPLNRVRKRGLDRKVRGTPRAVSAIGS